MKNRPIMNYIFVISCVCIFNIGYSQTTIIDSICVSDIEEIISLYSPILIDGRDSIKYCKGHIPNALIIDAFDSSAHNRINALARHDIYLVYCTKTNRASIIINRMKELGFAHIFFLYDGYVEYEACEKKIETCIVTN